MLFRRGSDPHDDPSLSPQLANDSRRLGTAEQSRGAEGPNLLGRPYPFKVVHITELLDQLVREGRLRTRGADGRRLAFHDPCQLVRRGGVTEAPRRLMDAVRSTRSRCPPPAWPTSAAAEAAG